MVLHIKPNVTALEQIEIGEEDESSEEDEENVKEVTVNDDDEVDEQVI